ncbi:MAG: FAD-dependent oxidoreductase [Nanoarchaeota archaeon]
MECKFTGKVERVWDENDRVKNIRLQVPEEFSFLPGQYLFADIVIDGRQLFRAYSIASSPHLKGLIDLCVTRVKGGPASNFLHNLKKGDELALRGPVGTFVLKKAPGPILFFAAGSGVAPFRSMIHFALEEGWKNDIHLIFGMRTEKDILYRKEWDGLKKHKNFHPLFTFSRQEGAETGYVQTKVQRFVLMKETAQVYICGLGKMVLETKDALVDSGFPEKHIFSERYD